MDISYSELGKQSCYSSQYDPSLLFIIKRSIKRREIGIVGSPQFTGVDFWTSFEISWLNSKGKPEVRIAHFEIEADSENIIESKSFKLYLNSFNNTRFTSEKQVISAMQDDLAKATNGNVSVQFSQLSDYSNRIEPRFSGTVLDALDIEITDYTINREYLALNGDIKVEETLVSDLLKSNCLVTNQPDWGSLMIYYQGRQITHSGLLKYIISFRNHNEFHEQCVERIFNDIMLICAPEKLLVYARYTRRGGLDINPMRYNFKYDQRLANIRLVRQ